jgi:hypothetical protein
MVRATWSGINPAGIRQGQTANAAWKASPGWASQSLRGLHEDVSHRRAGRDLGRL